MAAINVRRLDDSLKERLRIRAARHGRSMEEEVREILGAALTDDAVGESWVHRIRANIASVGGVELPIPRRDEGPTREAPVFE
jgi:plasmid stability protein